MNTNQIRGLIQSAVNGERQTHFLANSVRKYAASQGLQISDQEVEKTCQIIQDYITHAPTMLDSIELAAKQAGLIDQVAPMLEAAAQYFMAPDDVVPDQMGLIGLMDDAYLTHSLIQALADQYRDCSGNAWLNVNMTQVNAFIRGLIGEPQSSILDAAVVNTLNAPVLQQSLNYLQTSGLALNANAINAQWEDMQIDKVVDTTMGAWGIF